MIVYLIRHGLTEANEKRLYCGCTDLPLSPAGRQRLKELAATGGYPEAQRYGTSGMLRTEETFKLLYGERPHAVLPGLRETDFGVFECSSYEELKDRADYQTWITGDMEHVGPPEGESNAEVLARAEAALQPLLLEAGEDTVCITHGGVIAALMGKWFHPENRYAVTPEPGRGWAVTFDNGQPVSYRPVP